jgi:hypothetical protein
MSEDTKRPAVKARKSHEKLSKGARRRQRAAANLRVENSSTPYGHRKAGHTTQGISITVQIPPLRRLRQTVTHSKTPARRKFAKPILLVPVALLIGGALSVYQLNNKSASDTAAAAVNDYLAEPNYDPLIPSAAEASTQRFDGKRNLVSYTTTFSGTRITISQQKLPSSFTKDPNSLTKAAEKIRANQRIDTDKGPVYVGTDEKGNEQLAVYTGDNVLLFLHTDTVLAPPSWKAFIEQLSPRPWN